MSDSTKEVTNQNECSHSWLTVCTKCGLSTGGEKPMRCAFCDPVFFDCWSDGSKCRKGWNEARARNISTGGGKGDVSAPESPRAINGNVTPPVDELCVCGHGRSQHGTGLRCYKQIDQFGNYCPCDCFTPKACLLKQLDDIRRNPRQPSGGKCTCNTELSSTCPVHGVPCGILDLEALCKYGAEEVRRYFGIEYLGILGTIFEDVIKKAITEERKMWMDHSERKVSSDSPVASCDCGTKTSVIEHHQPGCRYRLICERDAARESGQTARRDYDAVKKERDQLQDDVCKLSKERDALEDEVKGMQIRHYADLEKQLDELRESSAKELRIWKLRAEAVGRLLANWTDRESIRNVALTKERDALAAKLSEL